MRTSEMRNLFLGAAALAAILMFSSAAAAQTAGSESKSANQPHSPWKYYPADRAVGDGGPAPKRDLTGTWAGPSSGANVPGAFAGRGNAENRTPPFTPLGREMFARNKPIGQFSPGGTNDPHARFCDPFGFP